MWFATKDGLNKYDGYQITVYRNNTEDPWSLPDNTVFNILEDENENLWIGTQTGGLSVFDRKFERFYKVADKSLGDGPKHTATSISIAKGRLLVSTNSRFQVWDISGILPKNYSAAALATVPVLFDFEKRQNHYYPTNALASIEPLLLPNGDLWCSLNDSVLIFAAGPNNKLQLKNKIPASTFGSSSTFFAAFPHTSGGNMINLVTRNEIIQFNLADFKLVSKLAYSKHQPGEVKANWFSMWALPDGQGNIWIKQAGNMLYKCNLNKRTVNYYHYLAKSTAVKSDFNNYLLSCIDQSGLIWMGSNGYGILKYNPAVENFNRIDGKPHVGSLSAFWVDSASNIITNDLNIFAGDGLKAGTSLLRPDQTTPKDNSKPFTACRDNNGDTWAFYNQQVSSGYFCINKKNRVIKACTDIELGEKNASFTFSDHFNNIWIGARNKEGTWFLHQLNKKTGKVGVAYPFPVAGSYDGEAFIMDWWQNKKGIFWFGTIYGLFSFDPQSAKWKQYKHVPGDSKSLSENKIYAICADPIEPDKYLWVGTNGAGLNRFEFASGNSTRYGLADGLPNLVLYKIFSDAQNNIWISTNNGLSCFNTTTGKFRNFTANDGLMGNEFNRFSAFKTKNNILYFGGVDGITWFDPARVLTPIKPAPLVYTGFSTRDIAYSGITDTTVLNTPIRYNKSINLPHDKQMFSISFALLDYSRNGLVAYKFRLEGFNKNWINSGNVNRVTYTNMEPGDYIFRVAALGKNGEWQEHPVPLNIHIDAPWWKSWWFIALVVAVAAGLGLILYWYRQQQKNTMRQLRNNIASDLHDEIGSTLSSIVVYSDIVRDKETDPKLKSIAHTINESSRHTLESMNDIVWSINPNNDSFENVLLRIRSTSYELLEAINCKLVFDADPALTQLKLSMIQRRNLYLIFKESLNNIIKHAHPQQVSIHFKLLQKNLTLTIVDDGVGFTLQDCKEGNGLVNMQKRAKELNGKISLSTTPKTGCSMELTFPVA